MSLTVVDASALAAVTFREQGFEAVATRLNGARVIAPHLLKYELANIARLKARRRPSQAVAVFRAVAEALNDRRIAWHDVNATDVAVVALATGLTAYDASYLVLAGSLGADLVTLDQRLAAVCSVDIDSSFV